MNGVTTIVRPSQSQVRIDPTPRQCLSEGFNFPTFRLINKKARVNLSGPLNPGRETCYHLFTVANSRGWFAAARRSENSYELVFSPLDDLRSSIKAAKEDNEEMFQAKRVIPLAHGKLNHIAFANQDSRLLVAMEDGSILVYDTAAILSEGSDEINPLNASLSTSGPIRQLVPNPGTEPNLSDLFAVVRGDGMVQLLNTQLEIQGGWSPSDMNTVVMAASWSPKGKHLALGIKAGDILTFSLTNKSSPNKHIPPTANGALISLEWTGPGHTFRTSYATQDGSDAVLHAISLDTKSSTATYTVLNHPYVQSFPPHDAYSISLPKWDYEMGQAEETALYVVGDYATIELEVIGCTGTQWYQESQENPLSLPLNKDMDDTALLGLAVDLTESEVPVMYAYLDDGTIQGWNIDHSKPYSGMISAVVSQGTPHPQPSTVESSNMVVQQDNKPSFGQQPTSIGAFGQSSPAFGQSAFSQQQSVSAFGQASPQSKSPFGQTVSSSGGFGAFASSGASPFGKSAQGPSSSASGGTSQPSGGAFGNFNSTGTTNVFGGSSFGFGSTPANLNTPSTEGNVSAITAPTVTREASMQDSTSSLGGFGGLNFGSSEAEIDEKVKSGGGLFGAFSSAPAAAPSSSATISSGGLVKPATGFGAFSNFKTVQPTSSNEAQSSSAFGASGSKPSSFGQPAFGQSGFGAKPAFGQSSFGQTGFPKPTVPTTGGFGSFASQTPSAFGAITQSSSNSGAAPSTASGSGFAAFASKMPSAFGAAASSNTGAFGQQGSTPFTSGTTSAFASTQSGVGENISVPVTPKEKAAPKKSLITQDSPPSSPEATMFNARPSSPDDESPPSTPAFKSTAPAPTSGAFGGLQLTPSAFKPAAGFGAFGSNNSANSSPFFKKPEDKLPVSVFSKPPTPAQNNTPSSTPSFGAPSLLGSGKPFHPPAPTTPTPEKQPVTGAFSAFSGASTAFGSTAGSKTSSFSELLKTDVDSRDPVKPSTSGTPSANRATPASVSVFGSPSATPKTPAEKAASQTSSPPSKTPISAFPVISKAKQSGDNETAGPTAALSSGTIPEEPSVSNVSVSSTSSSFVEVNGEVSEEGSFDEQGGEGEPPEDYEDEPPEDDEESFLSDSVGSHGSSEDEDEDERSDDEETPGRFNHSRSSSPVTEPSAIPLPASRSPSSTPQPDVPKIQVSSTREASTTPPGSPAKEQKSGAGKSPVLVPVPPIASPPSGIGLGRPSTRPTRSSPLASAPVSGDDEGDQEEEENNDDDDDEPLTEVTIKPPVSPRPNATLPLKKEADDDSQAPPSKRPKTPPLLSSFGERKTPPIPSTPVLAHATPPGQRPSTVPPFSSAKVTPPQSISQSNSLPTSQAEKSAAPSPSPGLFKQSSFFAPPTPGTEANNPKVAPAFPSLFGVAPTAGLTLTSPPPPTSGAFSMPQLSAKGAATTGTVSSNLFNNKQSPSSDGPSTPSPSLGLFGQIPSGISKPSGSFLGSQPQPRPPPATPSPATKAPQIPEATMEDGMQKECAVLVLELSRELENLRVRAQEANKKCAELGNSPGGPRKKSDLSDSSKWAVSDAAQFGRFLAQYEDDLVELRENLKNHKQSIRLIQSSMLKAGTRKEEIARFNKAKNDAEFAKMLRARTLGPEHLETQTTLRRNIRVMRDRIQKLEDVLQASKRNLSQAASGQPSIRPPSLDTINRTYRNIDIAIQQQADDVSKLSTRISKLKLTSGSDKHAQRDARLPDVASKRPYNVTPNVAVTTAAALNAERSAHRLKRALLIARKEPLLNTKAASAAPPPTMFKTPMKAPSFGFDTSLAWGSLLGRDAVPDSPETPSPTWTLPEDNFNPSPLPPARRGAGSGQKKHGSVALKKSPGLTSSPSLAPAFDWGPLPTFNNTPRTSLPADFNIGKASPGSSGGLGLPSGGWLKDGLGKKA